MLPGEAGQGTTRSGGRGVHPSAQQQLVDETEHREPGPFLPVGLFFGIPRVLGGTKGLLGTGNRKRRPGINVESRHNESHGHIYNRNRNRNRMPRIPLHALIWSPEQLLYELYTQSRLERRFRPADEGADESADEGAWLVWLREATSFAFHGAAGSLNLYWEARPRGGHYWYALE
jgi:hypothetical protein